MDVLEAAKKSGFIAQGDRKSFIDELLRKPTPQYFLDPHAEENRLQGDLLKDFPFPRVDSQLKLTIKEQLVLVLNNTCDLQPERRDVFNFALASNYGDYEKWIKNSKKPAAAKNYLKSVTENGIHGIFYVEKCPPAGSPVVVFLDQIATLPISCYEKALENGQRLASLSQHGFYHFLIKLTTFLARSEAKDVASRGKG